MKRKRNIYDADDAARSKRLRFSAEERAAHAEKKAEVLGQKLEKAKAEVPKQYRPRICLLYTSKAEALLYQALIAYIYYEAPAEEKNMTTLLDMLNACECREDDENFKSAVDLLFEQLQQKNPDHFAVRQYLKFKMAAGKTLKSILISCGARLAPFDIQAVREMMEYDELELEKLGDEKIALFAVVSDSDPTFNFISAMMYSQMFNVLCNRALTVYHGRLPVHVTCLFDEFANQKIPNWEHLVSVIRSRNISAHIVLQTYSQLKGMYKDNAETIAGCCSSLLFLGGKEESSLKMVSTMLGKETIDTYNTSDTRGTSRSYGPVSYTHLDVYKRQVWKQRAMNYR